MAKTLVIYDGECGICNFLKEVIHSLDKSNNLKFISYHDPKLQPLVKISQKEASKSIYTITKRKEIFRGFKGILVLLSNLNRTHYFFAKFLIFFRLHLAFEPVYYIIAKYRKKISTLLGLNACKI